MAVTGKGARTRSVILEIAADSFATSGYAEVNLNDLVRRAGVTKGAFYFHFPSKESLAHAICDSYHAHLEDIWRGLGVTEPDALRRIIRLVFEAFSLYRRDA